MFSFPASTKKNMIAITTLLFIFYINQANLFMRDFIFS